MNVQASIDSKKQLCQDHIADILPLLKDVPSAKLDEVEMALEIALGIAKRKREQITGIVGEDE